MLIEKNKIWKDFEPDCTARIRNYFETRSQILSEVITETGSDQHKRIRNPDILTLKYCGGGGGAILPMRRKI